MNAQVCAFIGIGGAFIACCIFIAFDIHSRPVRGHRVRASMHNGVIKMRRCDTGA